MRAQRAFGVWLCLLMDCAASTATCACVRRTGRGSRPFSEALPYMYIWRVWSAAACALTLARIETAGNSRSVSLRPSSGFHPAVGFPGSHRDSIAAAIVWRGGAERRGSNWNGDSGWTWQWSFTSASSGFPGEFAVLFATLCVGFFETAQRTSALSLPGVCANRQIR